MAPQPVAQALYEAHKAKATGWLTLSVSGRESQLQLEAGDIVGARVGFGHQTLVQALVGAGKLDLSALDALWARGEGGALDTESLEQSGTSTDEAHALQVLANVRSLSRLAQEASFTAAPVQPMFAKIAGLRAVRAAFETLPAPDEPQLYRCVDPSSCDPWLFDDAERALLTQAADFQSLGGRAAAERGLIQLLALEGKVELLSVRDHEARQTAQVEEAAQQAREAEAESARRSEAEREAEAARQAENEAEAARIAEAAEVARQAHEAQQAEQARQAEEARVEAERQAQEARREEEAAAARAAAAEAARFAEEERLAEEERIRLAERFDAQREVEEAQAFEAAARAQAEQQAAAERLAAQEPQFSAAESDAGSNESTLDAAVQSMMDPSASRKASSLDETSWADLFEGSSPQDVGAEPLPAAIEEPIALFNLKSAEALESAAALADMPEAEVAMLDPVLAVEPSDSSLFTEPQDQEPVLAIEPAESAEPPPSAPEAESVLMLSPEEAESPPADDVLALDSSEILAEPAVSEPTTDPQAAPLGAADADGVEAARAQAQAQLVAEMNEALRRSGANSEPDPWLDSSDEGEGTIELSSADAEPTQILTPSVWSSSPAPDAEGRKKPLILGPQSNPRAEEDLWKLVSADGPAAPPAAHASFEEALRKVDSHLEALVGLPSHADSLNEPLVEAIIETTFDEPTGSTDQTMPMERLPDDNPARGEQTQGAGPTVEETWPFDEEDLATDPTDPAEAAKQRRQRLLRRAMQNLGAMGPRPTAPPAETEAPPTAEDTRGMSSDIPAAGQGPRSTDEKQLVKLIEKRFQDIKNGVDRFTILGLTKEATREQVKGAFLELAKLFHPDRLPASLSDLSPKMNGVFEGIRDAYEILYDDGKRRAYVMSLNAPTPAPQGGKPTKESEAEDAYRKGEAFFRKREYIAAEEQFEHAYQTDAKATYLAALGWALYMDPARKSESDRARKLMNDALKLDPNCDRAHYQLGVICRVEGDMDRAEKHFRDAVRANGKHLEANQELRLIEMRKKNSKKGGFFR